MHKKPRKILTGIISAIDTLFLILERQRERQTDRQTEKERERERESRSRNLSRNLSLDREWSVKSIITFPSNYRPFNRKSTIRVDSAKIWPPLPDFLDIHIRSSFGTDRANRSRSSFAQIALINRITNEFSILFVSPHPFLFFRSIGNPITEIISQTCENVDPVFKSIIGNAWFYHDRTIVLFEQN